MDNNSKSKRVMNIINVIAVLITLAVIVFACIYFYDTFKLLSLKNGKELLIKKIKDTGIVGAFLVLLLQIFQVIVAFIPGEVVEIVAGVMFGPFLGLVICLIGLNIATLIIYWLVKTLGSSFVKLNIKEKLTNKIKTLNDPRRSLIILFFIFLIPGIPKDIFIYLIPMTNVNIFSFMLVSTIARIPSIVTSTLVGSSIITQNYLVAGIIFGVTAIISVLGLVFNKKINNFIDKFGKKKNEVEETIDEK